MPPEEKQAKKGGGGDASADGKKANKPPAQEKDSGESVPKPDVKNTRKRKDGAPNKMSFDVDELEEGLYVQVEDEEDVEEVIEYEEIPDGEGGQQDETGTKESGKDDKLPDNKAATDENTGYKIRPDLSQKFRPGTVQVIIERAIKDKLEGREYSTEEAEEWVQAIMVDVHEKVKNQNYRRYKIITGHRRREEGRGCFQRDEVLVGRGGGLYGYVHLSQRFNILQWDRVRDLLLLKY